jgi:HK97 family phage portal protein
MQGNLRGQMFKKLFGKFRSEKRSTPAPSDDFWYHSVSSPNSPDITDDIAMKYITNATCVMLISGDIAKLPLGLYRKTKSGNTEKVNNHLNFLLSKKPNSNTNPFNWKELGQSQLLRFGNAYYVKEIKNGRVNELWQTDRPQDVTVERLPSGILTYKIPGIDQILTQDEVLHISGFGGNGIVGVSPLTMAAINLANAIDQQKLLSKYLKKGSLPTAVISMDQRMGQGRKQFEADLEAYFGSNSSKTVLTLNPGMKLNPLSVSFADSQFLELSTVSKSDLAAFYFLPQNMLNIFAGNSNRASLESENRSYVDRCLGKWASRWEKSLDMQLLSDRQLREDYFFKFNFNALLKGDSKARAELYKTFWQMGMPLNRILDKENENEVDGGDHSFIQKSYCTVENIINENVTPVGQDQFQMGDDTEEEQE